MNVSRDKLYLLHIKDAAEKAANYLSKTNLTEFSKNNLDYDAILMQIIVIGESVNNLSDEFKEEHRDLPWYEAVGLRNRIAHGYFDIKPEVVWKTVEQDLPKLKKQVQDILKNF